MSRFLTRIRQASRSRSWPSSPWRAPPPLPSPPSTPLPCTHTLVHALPRTPARACMRARAARMHRRAHARTLTRRRTSLPPPFSSPDLAVVKSGQPAPWGPSPTTGSFPYPGDGPARVPTRVCECVWARLCVCVCTLCVRVLVRAWGACACVVRARAHRRAYPTLFTTGRRFAARPAGRPVHPTAGRSPIGRGGGAQVRILIEVFPGRRGEGGGG